MLSDNFGQNPFQTIGQNLQMDFIENIAKANGSALGYKFKNFYFWYKGYEGMIEVWWEGG